MSELAGNSQSAIVGELLEQAQPVFERVVKVLEVAHKLKLASKAEKDRMSAVVASDLEQMQTRLEHQLGLGLEDLDRRAFDLADQAERIQRRAGAEGRGAPAAPAGSRTTPMSNRGVTPHLKREKQAGAKAGSTGRPRVRRGPV